MEERHIPQNLAMAGRGGFAKVPGMHSRSLESLALIAKAVAVDLVVYSRDGDPLAVVEIPRREAERLVRLPEAMGHVFRAHLGRSGRATIEATVTAA